MSPIFHKSLHFFPHKMLFFQFFFFGNLNISINNIFAVQGAKVLLHLVGSLLKNSLGRDSNMASHASDPNQWSNPCGNHGLISVEFAFSFSRLRFYLLIFFFFSLLSFFFLCVPFIFYLLIFFFFLLPPPRLSLSLCVSLVLSRSHDRGGLRCTGVLAWAGAVASRAISCILLLGFECGRWRRVRQWKWKKGVIISERRSRMGFWVSGKEIPKPGLRTVQR